MTKVIRLSAAFADSRGEITDIFANSPKDHCAHITFTSGAKRADHYHKLSIQFTYILSGSIIMRTAQVDQETSDIIPESIEEVKLQIGDFVEHKPYQAHAFLAIEDSCILAFACGMRGGINYEKDVYRLSESLFNINLA